MVMKTAETIFVEEPGSGYNEEQLQKIKDWINNPLTQNLSNHLKEIIETEKKNWLFGGYVVDNKKSLGDFNAGYCKGLLYTADFIESGGKDIKGSQDA